MSKTQEEEWTWEDAYDPAWEENGSFYAANNQLTSLKGAPSVVSGYFNCSVNKLTSLEGGPSSVGNGFHCAYNKLTSLKGAPSFVDGGDFNCAHNLLSSLEGAPPHIVRDFYCGGNNLTSLKDIHLQIKHIGGGAIFDGNPIKSHVLGLLLINGLQGVSMDNRHVWRIVDKYLPSKGMESVLLAQEELIVAGLEEYAQL